MQRISLRFQKEQLLTEENHSHHQRQVRWVLSITHSYPQILATVLFIEETSFFTRVAIVNIHNAHMWAMSNPTTEYVCQVIYSQFGLAIHQNDHQARRRFVEWAQNEITVVPDFHKRILLSDETHFWLNGYVNRQNCRIWSEANPQVAMITNFFIPELNNHDVQELWFQQDSATCHTARATINLLKYTFADRLSSRFGPVNWPPISCDLTPLD
ncbi:uncharacterized protein TNCV_2475911 [Trichonephila clavipes]|nr:uncharacterized protein TNCV_2475911 [Trichonephila clavipes]